MSVEDLILYLALVLSFLGAIVGALIYEAFHKWKMKRASSKMEAYIAKIKEEANKINEENKKAPMEKVETHVLKWRHDGQMHEVKIIIDPALDTAIETSQADFEAMVKTGDGGKLQDLLDGFANQDIKDRLASRDTFVFSRKSVEQMKMVDMAPDEIVTKILKSAGRMD